MKANKTQPTTASVDSYISSIENQSRRSDAQKLLQLIQVVTGEKPVLWGTSIVGFGNRHYKYASGREGDIMKVGFAVRKQAITLYGLLMFEENNDNIALAKQLGPHSHGKGCLYIKSLKDIDLTILKKMIDNSYNKT